MNRMMKYETLKTPIDFTPPNAWMPSYMTTFQSSPVRICQWHVVGMQEIRVIFKVRKIHVTYIGAFGTSSLLMSCSDLISPKNPPFRISKV